MTSQHRLGDDLPGDAPAPPRARELGEPFYAPIARTREDS